MQIKANGVYGTVYGQTLIGSNLIDGQHCGGDTMFNVLNPACSQDLVGVFPLATKADVLAAVRAANAALEGWKAMPLAHRSQILARFALLLNQHRTALSKLLSRELGKVAQRAHRELQSLIDTAEFYTTEGLSLFARTESQDPLQAHFSQRRPLGTIAIISDGHFPNATPVWNLIPALLCGNTVVWKPSESGPSIAWALGRLLEVAGLPSGVLNILHGESQVGESLMQWVEKGLIQHVSFSGSEAVGRNIGEICGRNLIPHSLDLATRQLLLVLNDADLATAVKDAIRLSFGQAPEPCQHGATIILQHEIAKPFRERFLKATQEIRVGDPSLDRQINYGPLLSPWQLEAFLAQLEWAASEGAHLLEGKGRMTRDKKTRNFIGDPELGHYVWPVIWDQVSPEMKIAQVAISGPSASLIEVADLDAAMSIAKAMGFNAGKRPQISLYTQNQQNILRLQDELEATLQRESLSKVTGLKGLDTFSRWHQVQQESHLAADDSPQFPLPDLSPILLDFSSLVPTD